MLAGITLGLNQFISEGFVICEIGHVVTSYKFCSPIKRNNPSTFTSLYT